MTRWMVVCVGNYCRSPMAEAILRQRVAEAGAARTVEVASAGTHPFQPGGPPHPLTLAVLRDRGVDASGLHGRAVTRADFSAFDRMLAVDRSVLRQLEALADAEPRARRDTGASRGAVSRVELLLPYGHSGELDLVDPFLAYSDRRGFERVFDLLDDACRGLLAKLLARDEKAAAAGE